MKKLHTHPFFFSLIDTSKEKKNCITVILGYLASKSNLLYIYNCGKMIPQSVAKKAYAFELLFFATQIYALGKVLNKVFAVCKIGQFCTVC